MSGRGFVNEGIAFQRIKDRLRSHGFQTKPKEDPRGSIPFARFYKSHGDFELRVDFLTSRKDTERDDVLTIDNMMVPIPKPWKCCMNPFVIQMPQAHVTTRTFF